MNKQEIEKAILQLGVQMGHEDRIATDESLDLAITALEKQLNNGWIPVSEGLPEEHRCLDEDDCYRMSDNVLCSAYNEDINEYETWIDYTIDGEWQTHEYYEGEKLAWQPLPEPYQPE